MIYFLFIESLLHIYTNLIKTITKTNFNFIVKVNNGNTKNVVFLH